MLEKAIEHGKEHRKPYYDSRAVDRTCRNHGDCHWCKNNRLYCSKKRIEKIKYDLLTWWNWYTQET